MDFSDNNKTEIQKMLVDFSKLKTSSGYALCNKALVKEKKDKSGMYLQLELIDVSGQINSAYLFNYDFIGSDEVEVLEKLENSLIKVGYSISANGFIIIERLSIKDSEELRETVIAQILKDTNGDKISFRDYISEEEESIFKANLSDISVNEFDNYLGYSRGLQSGYIFVKEILDTIALTFSDMELAYKIVNIVLKEYIYSKNFPGKSRLRKISLASMKAWNYLSKEENAELNYVFEALLYDTKPKTLLAFTVVEAVNYRENLKNKLVLDMTLNKGEGTSEWVKI